MNDGDYALFSTDTYEQSKKNIPEFEELAAMESGINFLNPLTTRRDGGGSLGRIPPWASLYARNTSARWVESRSRATVCRRG